MSRKILASFAAFALLGMAGSANAQWGDPESGDTGQWQPPPDQQPPQQPPPQQPPPQQPPPQWQQPPQQQQQGQWYQGQQQQQGQQPSQPEQPPAFQEETPGEEPDTDHAAVVGSVGFTFLGVQNVTISPVGLADGYPTLGEDRLGIRAPMVGIRTWFSESIGLDVGLGLGVGDLAVNGNGDLIGGLDGQFAIGIHAGLPVSVKAVKHFNVLLLPEFSFGYGKATLQNTEPTLDLDLSGIQLNIGARFGGELQFGFWGLPNLSLQATIGLGVRYAKATATGVAPDGGEAPEFDTSEWSIRTIANDIFNGTIRAIYYF